ncbi:MAG: hypothetical protein J6A88_06435 [Oscillospiraceae bacterium]|nr:hypothetical protein [Oscillospiraceae bacterium]
MQKTAPVMGADSFAHKMQKPQAIPAAFANKKRGEKNEKDKIHRLISL